MFRCSRKFSAGTTKKVMFHLLSNRIFRNIFVNGKQPGFWSEKLLSKHEKQTKKKNDNKSKTNNLTNKQKTKTTLDLQDTNMGLVAGYS